MADQTGRLRCQAGCWIAASVIGLLAIIISALTIEISVTGAIFVGVLVTVALGVILSLVLCQPLSPPKAAGTAPTVGRTGATAPRAAAAPGAPASTDHVAASPDDGRTPASDAGPERAAVSPAAAEAAVSAARNRTTADADMEADASGAGTARQPTMAEAAPAAVPEAADAPTDADKPVTLDAPREGGADDLKQIKGIGPKLEKLLHSMGFYHFDQVAAWTDRELAWVDSNLEGFKGRASRDNWIGQARTLASGGSTAFSDKVKGGDVY